MTDRLAFRVSLVAVRALVTTLLAAGAVAPLAATQVKIFQTQTRSAFLAGTPEGVSIDPLGRLELADRIEPLTAVAEPFLFSAAMHPQGWVAGTGNAGKVLLIDRQGDARELFAAPEPEVFAVWADPDGTVFAGTSPQGKVYRITPGEGGESRGEVFFDPGETYIWSLTRDGEGSLLVATGTQGKLYRVDPKGRGEVLYDSEDTHLRSLAVLPDGDLLIGTAGEGLILRLSRSGGGEPTVRTLYDAAKPEVVALALAPDGSAYAALAASEASLVDLSPSSEPEGDDEEAEVTVSVEVGAATAPAATAQAPAAGSRRSGTRGPRSELLRIAPGGLVESLAELEQETIFSLLWNRGRLWLGTGLEGKLYSWNGPDGDLVLEKDFDERQVVALLPDDPGPAIATTNAAAFHRVTGASEREGTYTSATLDAGQISQFGSFRWRGEVPRKGELAFAFRSGMSSEPDRTWSRWTEAKQGEEISLYGVPSGRYLQWQARFRAGDGASPTLFGVELSYLQQNLAPKIERLEVLDPGQILVPSNFNPMNQVYEPAHPNREGIFTTLEPSTPDGDPRLKQLWKKGFRSLRWRVKDPNDDHLAFDLDFRPENGGGEARTGWMQVARELSDDHYSFDATVLPDGIYRFRLRATDEPHNDGGKGRTAEQVSEPVVVDHSTPLLETVRRISGGRSLEVQVSDAWSPLTEAVVSIDAGEWEPVIPTDGLLDSRRETLRIELPEDGGGPHLILLRLTDASFNVVTFDLESGGGVR